MKVIDVYNNLMTRISDLKKYREAYRAKKTPLDTMEAEALTNILMELYAVAADLESTEEVNPPSCCKEGDCPNCCDKCKSQADKAHL